MNLRLQLLGLWTIIAMVVCRAQAMAATSKLQAAAVPFASVATALPAGATGAPAVGASAQKPDATYFLMDLNGSYKYAFDSGTGYQGEQSADAANEVIGQYSYYDKGMPYMVRYKAGKHGFQPVVIPTAGATAAKHTLANPVVTQFMHIGSPVAHTSRLTTVPAAVAATTSTATVPTVAAATIATTEGIATPVAAANVFTELPKLQLALTAPAVTSAGHIQPTLKFVQDIMKTMQTQPLQISFATQQAHVQQATASSGNRNGDAAAAVAGATPFTSATRAEAKQLRQQLQPAQHQLQQQQQQQQQHQQLQHSQLQLQQPPMAQIQSQVLHAAEEALPKRPYAYSYKSDQSAHSESADTAGNIVGSYSYYDEAGYHELSYKAGDDIGFVVLSGKTEGRNAAAATVVSTAPAPAAVASTSAAHSTAAATAALSATSAGAPVPQLVVNVSQEPNISYSYTVEPLPLVETNSVEQNIRGGDGRSLRKFRRYANW